MIATIVRSTRGTLILFYIFFLINPKKKFLKQRLYYYIGSSDYSVGNKALIVVIPTCSVTSATRLGRESFFQLF